MTPRTTTTIAPMGAWTLVTVWRERVTGEGATRVTTSEWQRAYWRKTRKPGRA